VVLWCVRSGLRDAREDSVSRRFAFVSRPPILVPLALGLGCVLCGGCRAVSTDSPLCFGLRIMVGRAYRSDVCVCSVLHHARRLGCRMSRMSRSWAVIFVLFPIFLFGLSLRSIDVGCLCVDDVVAMHQWVRRLPGASA